MELLEIIQWLCCGWTCLKDCCACCGNPSSNPGDGRDPNGSQNISIKNICENCSKQCYMCCYASCTCCNSGGRSPEDMSGRRGRRNGSANSRPSDTGVHQSQSGVGSNKNNSLQIVKKTNMINETGQIQDHKVHQSHSGVGQNNNNSLQILHNGAQVNEIGKIQADNYGTQQIFKDAKDIHIHHQYPAPNNHLDEQSKNINNSSNSINPEIIGDDNKVEFNILHSSKPELNRSSFERKSGNQHGLNINPKIMGTGNNMRVNVIMHRWNSFPEDHVDKEIIMEKIRKLQPLNWNGIEEENET